MTFGELMKRRWANSGRARREESGCTDVERIDSVTNSHLE